MFLEVRFAVSVARMATRDGSHLDPTHAGVARYVRGQQLYFAACRPWQRTDLVVDATDLDHPTRIRSQETKASGTPLPPVQLNQVVHVDVPELVPGPEEALRFRGHAGHRHSVDGAGGEERRRKGVVAPT